MSPYFPHPNLKEITLSELRLMLKSKKTFVMLYLWHPCPDCKLLYEGPLSAFLAAHSLKEPLYWMDVHEFRKDGPLTDTWKAFAHEFLLDSYRGGKIPTIHAYQKGQLTDALVYVNDVREPDSCYLDRKIVKESSHKELVGQSLTRDAYLEFHFQKVVAFLTHHAALG